MERKLAVGTARFGLLHFSPYPEQGDRVCIGIWFDDGRRVTVEYDQRFHKLHCIAPEFNVKFVRLLLDDLSRSLRDAGSSAAEMIMKQYEPQLVSTESRRILVPLSDELREQLRSKFLLPSRELSGLEQGSVPSARIPHDLIAQRVRDYVRSLMPDRNTTMLERVTPYALFGSRSRIANLTVALAVERPLKVVLIDGVDLNVVTPRRAVTKVNQIVYAFWQFERVKEEALFPRERELQRVGIVLNGASRRNLAILEAHDYAMDRFREEADLTVDATTNEGRDQLIATLTD